MAEKDKVHQVMREFKRGTLRSGSKRAVGSSKKKKGPIVKSKRQAIAIAMSEARKKRITRRQARKHG